MRGWRIGLLLLALASVPAAYAEQYKVFHGYAVHYSALTTDFLDPEVARAYAIPRSRNRALLNISVIEQVPGTTGRAVEAEIRAEAVNPVDQRWPLAFRKVTEGSAIYYLAELPVTHDEELLFKLRVTLPGHRQPVMIDWRETFYVR